MNTQKPDPYGIDGPRDSIGLPRDADVLKSVGEIDGRGRPIQMEGVAIEPGRKCFKCGYDLTGLFAGGNCPECGVKILSVAPRAEFSAYKRMPNGFLHALSMALGTMAVMSAGGLAILIYHVSGGQWHQVSAMTALALAQTASIVWFACVVFICIPPPRPVSSAGVGRSRVELAVATLAVISQVGVLISAFYPALVKLGGLPMHGALIEIPLLVSFLGWAIVAFQLANIAERFDDNDRARRLRFAAICTLLGGGSLVIMMQPIGILLLSWGCFYFIWSLWSLCRDAGWAVANAKAVEARSARLRQRAKENYARAQREREGEAPLGGPLP